MRPVQLGSPISNEEAAFRQWVKSAFREIEEASNEHNTGVTADAYTSSNYTETRALNAGTATVADVANVLATFLDDLRKRGVKRT